MATPEPRLDRWLSLRVVAPLMRVRPTSAPPRLPILMYHAIADDADDAGGDALHPYFRTVTTPAGFARQVALLRRSGWESLTLTQAAGRLRPGGPPPPRRAVALTFDDGFSDFASAAWPVLERDGFTATVFVASGFVGRTFLSGRACLDATQLRHLADRGVEIGSHSVTHRPLGALTIHELRAELVDSRRALEDITGRAVRSFACPYRFPEHVPGFAQRYVDELDAAGYAAAVTTSIGRAAPANDPRLLPRLPVNDADDDALLHAKLQGHYDWVRAAQWLRKRARTTPVPEAA